MNPGYSSVLLNAIPHSLSGSVSCIYLVNFVAGGLGIAGEKHDFFAFLSLSLYLCRYLEHKYTKIFHIAV